MINNIFDSLIWLLLAMQGIALFMFARQVWVANNLESTDLEASILFAITTILTAIYGIFDKFPMALNIYNIYAATLESLVVIKYLTHKKNKN
jgi:hypothetical protein